VTPSVVEAFYRRIWNAGDLQAAAELLANDFGFRGSLGVELRGIPAFLDYVQEVRRGLAGYRCEILDCVAEGAQAFAKMRFSGQHVGRFRGYQPTGKHVEWLGAALFKFDRSRIVELWVLGDLAGLDDMLRTNESSTPRPALTEEEIRAATVGELKPLDGSIVLVDYNSQWPERFAEEAVRVRAVLAGQALRLEHVGSTAVPGLAAKPIIDMLLVVPDSADEATYAPALQSLGYALRVREPDWYQHRMFKGPAADINLHVFSAGCAEIDRMLIFRDRLRASGSDRDLYARTKTELAKNQWTHVQSYADAKTAVVDEIMRRATSGRR
jgi:GrpB-like predicted nucleotidyltransferase (UPF0157 family)/predicted ester cyclase